jgi:peptidoglycan/LPS O-acetylase OafA/YrhL
LNKSSRFLSSKPLVFIGDISYSTYLLQGVIYPFFKYNGNNEIIFILKFFGFFVCTYFAAYMTYKYFEVPARIYVRNFLLKGFGLSKNETN